MEEVIIPVFVLFIVAKNIPEELAVMGAMAKRQHFINKLVGILGLKKDQIEGLVNRIESNELYKSQKSRLGNPVILLGFLLDKIKRTGDMGILNEVLDGRFNEESLGKLNNMSYSTYLFVTA